MKKALFTIVALIGFVLGIHAQQNPLWLRHPAISPDGKLIAFSYHGDIFTVSASGGEARQITSNPAYDAYPVWSPDGESIAFASTREGSFDIYTVSKRGGAPTRITTNSGSEIPMTFSDANTILFSSSIMPSSESIVFPGNFRQVYSISTNGGRPKLYSALPMEDVSVNAEGKLLYHDNKGYEDALRKHHVSPITRDVWLKDGNAFTKMTSFNGEDRTPRWAADGKSFFYLSESNGTFNVYKSNLNKTLNQQITRFEKNPVRFLSVSKNDDICFAFDGEIYVMKEGSEPKKVQINVISDTDQDKLIRQVRSNGVTEVCPSPDGKEVAFIMHGDVYVTSTDYRTTRQITDTPEQERNVDFAPDGKSLVYAAERNGLWQIYQCTYKNSPEKLFAYATDIEETRLVQSTKTSQLPKFSPDGKTVAYLEDRGTIKVIDLKTKAVKTCLDGKYMYSYSDGDVWYEWSPDSRWFICSYIGEGGWHNVDIALVAADGSNEIHNLTQSGYNEGSGRWVLGGKAMLFESDRAGFRSHGSWGAESDAYLMFFDLDAYEAYNASKEEKELAAKAARPRPAAPANADKGGKAPAKKNAKKNDKKKAAAPAPAPEKQKLVLDLENCRDRVVRLTVHSSRLGDMILSNGGDTIYYSTRFEGRPDLWMHDMRENKTEIVQKGFGSPRMMPVKDGKSFFYAGDGGIKKFEMAARRVKNIDFEARFNYRPYDERKYLFEHVWQQVKDKFYDPALHNVDWDYYREHYARFLPYINNKYDFADMMSEMLGELNASHTGMRYRPNGGADLSTAYLGLFFDDNYEGDGLKVKEVIKSGPFDVRNTGVKAGMIITSIDGEPILKGKDYNYMLDGKAGKKIRVGVKDNKTGKSKEVQVRAITLGAQNDLLYKRWVDRNRQLVDSLSGGQIAYVHVKAMDSPSFRTVYRELLSDKNRNRKAAIVDERHNGGGWLHDDLCTLLAGKEYQKFIPHGQFIGIDPFNKWTKPSCVLMCEDDYSNGHGFPKVYSDLKLGQLIGTPVAGTMTAVWWETLMDSELVFGIPQVGCLDMNGKFGENQTLYPDVEVYNSPADLINGHDTQLEKAVKLMMEK